MGNAATRAIFISTCRQSAPDRLPTDPFWWYDVATSATTHLLQRKVEVDMHSTLRVRFLFLLIGGLALALVFAIPFAAQQPPFDAARIIANTTNALQLTPEQTSKLTDLINKRRPRIDGLLQKMSQFPPHRPVCNELRGAL